MNEEIIELEIKEEPGEEEKPEKASKMPKIEGAVPATAGLKIVLKNPKISIDKLILKKKE
ncbi:hypothetical protein AKJ59_00555 [candidate division MSBL1 archaeon SCGC-AAA385M02]|uniref:Uncharacterized protein n=1 Tax=candidate division MSBL1 archaeon SCGC-AAA385M02 TaxID=1698287 RepID=A0A133VQL6_9EURY|nr:hypothetical protein AKJ59_00555 [candidate division MSBL1 archaeon SCGC-AAA385M02]